MNLSKRQQQIIQIVEENQPVTGTEIANVLGLSKSTIRSDLSLLTHTNKLDAKPKVGYIINESIDKPVNSQLLKTKVNELKSKAVCVKESISLHDAIIKIFLNDAGTVFVINDQDYLCGVVSRKDFLKSILGNVNIHSVPVSVIMTRMPNIVTISGEESIINAAQKIIQHKIDALPVVEEVDTGCFKITGRISKTTISKLFVQLNEN